MTNEHRSGSPISPEGETPMEYVVNQAPELMEATYRPNETTPWYDAFLRTPAALKWLPLILVMAIFGAGLADAEMGFDPKYERAYNIFNPASRYQPDNPLNSVNVYDPDNPFNPVNRYDLGNPTNPVNRYNPNNPFNSINQFRADNPLNPINRYNPNVPFRPLDGMPPSALGHGAVPFNRP